MKIFQISDLHLSNAPGKFYNGLDTLERCKKLISYFTREKADLLVVTGDIGAESEEMFCYNFLKQQLEKLSYPWVVLPGNHDRGALFMEIFGANAKTGFDVYHGNGTDILFFDSSYEEPMNLEALENYLQRAIRPMCLFTHYPPVLVGHPSYDGKHRLSWQNLLLDALQRSEAPLHVFFGHIHYEFYKKINQIHFYSVPSGTVPVVRGENCDLPDENVCYFREIGFSDFKCETTIRTL